MHLRDYCEDRWPELWQFFGYFHQDFLDEYGSAEGAIDAFLNESDPEYVQKVLGQLEEYLEFSRDYLSRHPEEQYWLLESMRVAYNPGADGYTEIGWLEHVRQRLRDYLAKTKEQ